MFCTQCGWENPADSRYCSQCGAAIQIVAATRRSTSPPVAAASAVPPESSRAPDRSAEGETAPATEGTIGRRLLAIFGLAIVVIVALFLVDAVSSGGESEAVTEAPVSEGGAMPTSSAPLDADLAARIDALRAEVEGLSGEARIARRREIVEALASANRFDKAAQEQEAIASETGTEADWIRAGNLNYDWMDLHDGMERAAFAKAAIAAYRKALERNPDNLDVRTDLAVAYMSDPDNPMLAIQETAAVLAIDSLHVQANFNRGIMLLQINRIDGAIAQFEKVKRIVGNPEDPMFVLAEQALISVRQQAPVAPAPVQ